MGIKPQQLQINPELRRLVAPLPDETRLKQEKWMAYRGQSLPIRVWDETILVDYETYSYSRTQSLPFHTTQVFLKSYDDAVIWICRDQLKRNDLTEEMRKYLIGKLYLTEKKRGTMVRAAARDAIRAGEKTLEIMQTPAMQGMTAGQAADRISREYHIAHETARKYGKYAAYLDHLYAYEPVLVQRILEGAIYISHENIFIIRSMNRAEIASVARYFLNENERRPTFNKYQTKLEETEARHRKKVIPAGSIKEMPAFDPDAAVASLSLTIPSWIGSIQRTEKNTEFSQISEQARGRLLYELDRLADAIEGLAAILEEEAHG